MDHAVEGQRRKRMADAVFFLFLLAGASAVTMVLFYRQTMGEIPSDMKAYILEMQGLDSGYSFPYPIFFKLAALIHLFIPPEPATAMAAMLLNGLAMAVVKLALNRLVLPGWKDTLSLRAAVSLLSVSLFFISMLYTPGGVYLPGIHFRYLGVFTPNPFHNATYMAARPFAVLAFLWYVKLLPLYEREPWKDRKGDYILFSVFLLLATMTKPSFTLVMVSACGLLMLYRLFRWKFRYFLPTVRLGLCFVPTFLDLLYQYKGVFVPEGGEEGGVGFGFGEVWANYCSLIPLAVCLAIGFPLLVLVLNYKEFRKNTLFRFSWMLYAVGFAEAFLLYEKGFRKPDFNFSWGYMYGIFFCHFGALAVLLQATGRVAKESEKPPGKGVPESAGKEIAEGKESVESAAKESAKPVGKGVTEPAEKEISGRKESAESAGKENAAKEAVHAGIEGLLFKYRKPLLAVQWAAYLCHLICGVLYFRDYFGGAMYY